MELISDERSSWLFREPGRSIPGCDFEQELRDTVGIGVEQVVPFVWGGVSGLADVTEHRAIVGCPTAIGGFKLVSHGDIRKIGDGADEIRMDGLDHGGFPFTCVAHRALHKVGARGPRFGVVPVGGEQEEEVASLAERLAHLEDGLPAGDVIPSVAVQEHDPLEAMVDCVFDQAIE